VANFLRVSSKAFLSSQVFFGLSISVGAPLQTSGIFSSKISLL